MKQTCSGTKCSINDYLQCLLVGAKDPFSQWQSSSWLHAPLCQLLSPTYSANAQRINNSIRGIFSRLHTSWAHHVYGFHDWLEWRMNEDQLKFWRKKYVSLWQNCWLLCTVGLSTAQSLQQVNWIWKYTSSKPVYFHIVVCVCVCMCALHRFLRWCFIAQK